MVYVVHANLNGRMLLYMTNGCEPVVYLVMTSGHKINMGVSGIAKMLSVSLSTPYSISFRSSIDCVA